MPKSSPADVIKAYRRRQQRSFPFTFAEISQGLLLLLIIASALYVAFTGGPKLPVLIDLKTNTPTFTPSITPTAASTATVTSTPTETPDLENQCNCSSPIVIVVTATFEATNSPVPAATETITATVPSTATLPPSDTPLPSPTPILYTVQRNDTLSAIALKFGVSVEAIQELNHLDTTFIYLGQVLQIPAH